MKCSIGAPCCQCCFHYRTVCQATIDQREDICRPVHGNGSAGGGVGGVGVECWGVVDGSWEQGSGPRDG